MDKINTDISTSTSNRKLIISQNPYKNVSTNLDIKNNTELLRIRLASKIMHGTAGVALSTIAIQENNISL